MSGDDAIRLEGTVIEALPTARWRVRLKNGHCLVARALRRRLSAVGPVEVGDRLLLTASPADLSHGIIEAVLNQTIKE